MTLIACLRAKDCIVMAADSLTTIGDRVASCNTINIHRIADRAIAAGAGMSRVMAQYWSATIPHFMVTTSRSDEPLLESFRNFLDEDIARVPTSNVGALQGGNKFTVASYDEEAAGFVISKLVSNSLDRRFDDDVVRLSDAADRQHISWLGDKGVVRAHVEETNAVYEAGMEEADAVASQKTRSSAPSRRTGLQLDGRSEATSFAWPSFVQERIRTSRSTLRKYSVRLPPTRTPPR